MKKFQILIYKGLSGLYNNYMTECGNGGIKQGDLISRCYRREGMTSNIGRVLQQTFCEVFGHHELHRSIFLAKL